MKMLLVDNVPNSSRFRDQTDQLNISISMLGKETWFVGLKDSNINRDIELKLSGDAATVSM